MSGYRIWDYVPGEVFDDEEADPSGIDFKNSLTIRLHPLEVVEAGELRKITYYAFAEPNEEGTIDYSLPITQAEFDYTRDDTGFALYRVATRKWYLDNGTLGPHEKVQIKYYTHGGSIKEGKRRRNNIIDDMLLTCLGLIIATTGASREEALDLGRDLLKEYQTDKSAFIDEAHRALINSIATDTNHAWLDNPIDSNGTTIRDYILSNLDI